MVRTVINLDPEDKAWLDRKAKEEKVSMTELVRRAVRRMREAEAETPKTFERLLQQTRGIWTQGDGLEYQKRLRDEWSGGTDK